MIINIQLEKRVPANSARTASSHRDILDHAARLLRLRGFEATTIDDVMLAAGLTRGAFYAHFDSKQALFREIVAGNHGLLRLLRERKGESPAALAHEADRILDDYLHKDHLGEVGTGCTLAALAGDVGRADLAAKLAYANALYALIAELGRALPSRRTLDPAATASAILAIGAIGLAKASGDRRLSDWLLRCARRATKGLMSSGPRAGSSRSRRTKPPATAPRPRRASPKPKRSRSRRKAAGARRSRRVAPSRAGRA